MNLILYLSYLLISVIEELSNFHYLFLSLRFNFNHYNEDDDGEIYE